jgi:PAS domain S-box-containing protein
MYRRRGSIRLWQTELFIIVIVVAIFILSLALTAGLRSTLTDMAEASELRNASALARQIEAELPVTVDKLDRVRAIVTQYRRIYGSGVWVYDRDGLLLVSAFDTAPPESALVSARQGGLAESRPYAVVDMQPGGRVIAAQALRGVSGSREGIVVTAGSVSDALDILQAARDRVWVTFWVSLVLAGLLGFAFSDLISRRMRAMSAAAAAIADGDFEQRLTAGFVPDEIQDLALSYNRMAARLGETFGELQDSRREIAAVVDSMAEGLVGVDAAGTVRVINPEAVQLLGASGRDLSGISAEELTCEQAVLDAIREGLEGRAAARTVALGQHMVLLNCTPLPRADGGVGGAVLLLADVTERHRVEEAQRRFVADASHELRTPITALKGLLELLADGAQDDAGVRDDFMRILQAEADRLARLVTDLLTLAKLEAGSLEFEIEPQWAADLVYDVASVMAALAAESDVTLSVDLPDGDVRVLAERDRIVQVLLGFTDNAVKHSAPGSTVTLLVQRNGDSVRLEVADEGDGIEPAALDRVFERFYRSDAARVGGKGTGLGLAIAKEIVEAHGSVIGVESNPGAGTRFWFDLPAA